MKKDKDDDSENTPEPVYHSTENFSSAYFGKLPDEVLKSVPKKYDRKIISTLIAQLAKPESAEMKIEVLKVLREGESQDLLVEILEKKEYEKYRKIILTACWESGLDFSAHLKTFIQLFGEKSTDDLCAVEISTVIEEMNSPIDAKEIEKNLELLKSFSFEGNLKKDLAAVIELKLKSFISS